MSADLDYTYTQCLLFIAHKASDNNSRKLRKNSLKSKSSTADGYSAAKGFVLFPEVFKKKRPEVIELFQQNDVHTLNHQNVSFLVPAGDDTLEVMELLLFESPSASLDPLTIVTSSVNNQTMRLFFPNITVRVKEGYTRNVRPAVDVKNFKHVKRLFSHKSGIHFRDGHKQSLLHLAVGCGPESLISLILERGGDIDTRTQEGITALHLATGKGVVGTVELLLDRGADIHARHNKGGTPLHLAATYGSVPVAQVLLNRGADIEAKAEGNITPLLEATFAKHEPIVRLLLERGADIQARDTFDQTGLHNVAYKGCMSIVELFLKKGATVEAKDKLGFTALISAVLKGNLDVVQLLLLCNADVNCKSNDGSTPIFFAIYKENIELLEVLLKFGAHVDIKDEEDQSVLDFAFFADYPRVFEYLLECRFLDPKLVRESSVLNFHHDEPADCNQDSLRILAQHVIKIFALNLFDDAEEMDVSPMWTDSIPTTISEFKTQCEREVVRMKEQTVGDTNLSFYNILVKDSSQMAYFLRNSSVARITDAELEKMFPIYGSILVLHFREGRERKSMLMEGVKLFNFLFRPHFKQLPAEIKEKILAYLTFKDLASCKEAFKGFENTSAQVSSLFLSL